MPAYKITPSDVLFFRDARPFESGSGRGARWPEPNIIFNALHAAFYRAWPEKRDGEHTHRHGKSGQYDNNRRDKRFGSLKTAGPFPVVEQDGGSNWFFTTPADGLSVDGKHIAPGFLPMRENTDGKSDLPHPLKFAIGAAREPDKNGLPAWFNKSAFESYLTGQNEAKACFKSNDDLFDSEWNTGIGIDPERQVQDGEHIYSAEYMRLRENVHLGVIALMPPKDALDELFNDDNTIVAGGQQRMCRVIEIAHGGMERFLPLGPEIADKRVKWILLSPAVFPRIDGDESRGINAHPGGWLPSWIDPETGSVLLTAGMGKSKAKRLGKQQGAEIRAKLVAARIPKPIAISGWSERIHLPEEARGARPTVLAVPAGAVYYFESDTEDDARKLADALNWHGAARKEVPDIINRRGAFFGEQGFGLGVCGSWKFFDEK